jgi:hypothetical protein
MKAFLISFLLFSTCLFAQMPNAITIEPPFATAYDTLTLIFDPAEACFYSGSLEGLDSVAFHSGVTYDNGLSWQCVVGFDEVGMNGQSPILYPTGDGRFSITYVPYEYYGFPEGAVVTEICAVFNNGLNWNQDGRDFEDEFTCIDFFIPIAHSCCPQGISFNTQEQVDNFPIDYPYCIEIEWSVNIGGNNDITNLNGLNAITSIGAWLTIDNSNELTNLTGLNNLTTIGSFLNIRYNQNLTSLEGLNNLNSIGGGIQIWSNDALTNIQALNNLTVIGDFLSFKSNNALTSFAGLENLTSIGGTITIWNHNSLASLMGLENISAETIIDNIYIADNISLSTCEVQSICDYLASPNGTIEIHDNAPGCNSQEEVEEACETVSIDEVSIAGDITLSPNPFTTSTTLSYELNQPEIVYLNVYNHLGQIVYQTQENQPQGSQQLIWNAEGYAEGVYYYKLQIGNAVATGKLVKVR